MKKLILALFSFAALAMVSCDKKEAAEPTLTPQEITGDYSAQTASVKVSGISYDMTGEQKIKVSGTDVNEMTIEIPEGIIPGEGKLTFEKVAFTLENSFTASATNDDRTISIKGHVHDNTLSVVITPEYKSALVGIYNFEEPNMVTIEDGIEEDISQVLTCKVETPSGKVTFFGGEQEQEYMDVFFNGLIGQMMIRTYLTTDNEDGTQTTTYNGALRNITFHADGNLTAEYNKTFSPSLMGMGGEPAMPEFVTSPMYAMRWYVKGDKLFLIPNINMMTRAGISQDGLALNLSMKDGKITIFADKTQVEPLLGLVNPLIQGLPDEVLGEGAAAAIAKGLVGELAVMTTEATRFDLGICLQKADKLQ